MGRGNCHYLHLGPFYKEYLPSYCLISESVSAICCFLLMSKHWKERKLIIVIVKFNVPDQHKKIMLIS